MGCGVPVVGAAVCASVSVGVCLMLVRCPRCEGTCSIDYLRRHHLGGKVTLLLHVVRAVFIGVVVQG